MTFTSKDFYNLNYILNQLGKRILPQYFYEKNPAMMNKWQNQICRQSHVLIAHLLDEWLNVDGQINYTIEFWEADFYDTENQQRYDHSWLFIQNIHDDKDRYICDVARVAQHIGVVKSYTNNPVSFLTNTYEVADTRKQFNWNLLFKSKEFYTGLPGTHIAETIKIRLKECNLIFQKS